MPRGVRTPEEVKDEIIALATAKISPYAISRELDMSVQTVYRILKEAGVKPLTGRAISGLDNVGLGRLLERYLSGDPVEEIRREASVSLATFYQLLDDAGVPRRHEQYLAERKTALDDAVTMYQQGKRLWQIHKATGVSSSTLTNELHARGLPTRRGKDPISLKAHAEALAQTSENGA